MKKEIREVVLFVTENCNLDCDYCYVKEKNGKNLDFDTGKKAIDLLKSSRSEDRLLHFFGGEPLLNFDIVKKLVEYGGGIKFQISTNGILLNDEILDFCEKNKIRLAISLDGDEVSHNRHRGMFNKIKKWDYGDIFYRMTVYPDLVDKMCENTKFLYENYSKKIDVVPAYGVVWTKKDLEIFDKEYGKILDFYYENFGDIHILSVEDEFINFMNPYQKYCPFIKNIVVLPNGDIILCPYVLVFDKEKRGLYVVGNVFDGFKGKWKLCSYGSIECKNCFPEPYCHLTCLTYDFKDKKYYDANLICNNNMLKEIIIKHSFRIYKKIKDTDLIKCIKNK